MHTTARLTLLPFFLLSGGVNVAYAGITDEVIWVGADALACDTDNLGAAVFTAPQHAIIRIANDQSYTDIALQVVAKHLTIEGGYSNCLDDTPSGVTQLRGAPGQAPYVVAVTGGLDGNQPYAITLRDLEIRGGEGDSGGGGGVLINDAIAAALENVDILGHHAALGAGLRIVGAGHLESRVTLDGVNIGPAINVAMLRNVSDSDGAGIHCQDARIWIRDANIRHNRAQNNGGGVWLDNCLFRVLHNGVVNRIADNQANQHGGGVYLAGSELTTEDPVMTRGVIEVAPSHLVIADNYADTDGGGVHASDSMLLLHDVPVTGNQAEFGSGAAFYLVMQSQLIMLGRRPGTADCVIGSTDCSLLAGNSGEFDGAIHALQGTMVSLDRTRIIGNTTTGGPAVLRFTGAGTQMVMMNSLVTDNISPSWLIQVTGGAQGLITGTTMTGNDIGSVIFRLHDIGSSLRLENSIAWQPGDPFIDGNGEFEVACLNAHDNSFHPAVETHDPGFANPVTGDYRLRGDSENIDRCAQATAGVPPLRDLDGTPRPQFMGGDAGITWDRGAYELSARLFRDRFEVP